ncbi:Diguanylate cyclase (modular protein) [Pseudomonas sp. JV551A1]|uniref:Diguanylate cyclase (Modular protein) n=1 Tax=Pseudomonas inefficax TaxID=2078786 RepID=A0AAQ1SS93_9PSED|nr:Diguanylate cyclase (modular protein) [Pseudomonas sp. JV551A1]SPO59257.1 Diguanylate cyclase (modular protein) [Pseudomonas inefficax]
MGAALAANTGAAGARHRVGFFAAKAAPTGYADRLRIRLSTLQRSPKGFQLSNCHLTATNIQSGPQTAVSAG